MSRPGFNSDLSGWKPQFPSSLNRHEWNSCPSRLFFFTMRVRFGNRAERAAIRGHRINRTFDVLGTQANWEGHEFHSCRLKRVKKFEALAAGEL
jgi:hypothetical protein